MMKKRKIAIATIAILLLIVGTVWAFRSRTDPRVEKVKQMEAELFKQNKMPDRAKMEEIHKAMQDLSPEQRHEVMEQGRAYFERRMDERVNAYFALPKEQRTAYLDKQIKEMEDHRKQMEANRPQGQGGSGGGPGGPGGTPPGAGGPPPGGPPQGGPPSGNNADARLLRRNQRLDSSTAEQRAKRSAYFAQLQQRRSELGLPPMTRPPRPPAPPSGTQPR
jgi:hypothetical protein